MRPSSRCCIPVAVGFASIVVRWRKPAATILLAVLGSLVVQAAEEPRVLTPSPSAFDALSRFAAVLDAIQKNYVRPSSVDAARCTTLALRTYVRSIDPEADLLSPEDIAATNAPPHWTDVGLRVAMNGDFPIIISPRDDSPAQDAGLLPGEQIVAVDKTPLFRLRRLEIEQLLRGPANSRVTLRVVDPTTGAARDLHMLRAGLATAPSVTFKFLDKGIAYCRLPEFTQPAVESLRVAMIRAKTEHASGVILDLRNNTGGTFDAAQVAASMFLPKDAPIVALEYATASQRASFVSAEEKKFTMPLALLINAGTAGEAELFAAALQDNKRAWLIGNKTFGRGFLTTTVPLADSFVLSMPSAYFMRPSNALLQGRGVTPDVSIGLPRQTERLLERIGFSTFQWPGHRTQVLATDLALAKAMSLLAR